MAQRAEERPDAVKKLEEVWPKLDDTSKIKLTAMVETVAILSEYKPQAATA